MGDEDNFSDDVRASDGTKVNITRILEWFAPAMENYCEMFDMERCPGDNINIGHEEECKCHKDNRWCLADGKCGLKEMSLRYPDGRLYEGEVDREMRPEGRGNLYFRMKGDLGVDLMKLKYY